MKMKQYLINEAKKAGKDQFGRNMYENELDCRVYDDYGNEAHFSNGSFHNGSINYSKSINLDDYLDFSEFNLTKELCKKISREALYTEVPEDDFNEYDGVRGGLWHNKEYYEYHFYLSNCY